MTKDFYRKLILNCNIGNSFETYSKVYSFTNENLADLYPLIHFEKYNSALTVLSSGDHAFNLIYMGIDKVDTFDTNRLTEYYALGLKKTAIQCLNYNEFMKLFSGKIERKQIDLLNYVIQNMEPEYRNYFETLIAYFKKYSFDYVIHLFRSDTDISQKDIKNIYLRSGVNYHKKQKRLANTTISFKHCDVLNIPKEFGKYDLVELSNILGVSVNRNWLQKKRVYDLLRQIYDNNLKHGELLFDYSWGNDFRTVGECSDIFDNVSYANKKEYAHMNDLIRS
ncbi:MAG: DUF3419 family protein [Bacilli bacterium]|nr:DUF3419 family protein [Bacilli bacterium]